MLHNVRRHVIRPYEVATGKSNFHLSLVQALFPLSIYSNVLVVERMYSQRIYKRYSILLRHFKRVS